MRWITSQNDTAPKHSHCSGVNDCVGLPVRTTLLQNQRWIRYHTRVLDYQSERHCSKTAVAGHLPGQALDYQSERHCSKTSGCVPCRAGRWITSQNDTAPKPMAVTKSPRMGWITSQNDTAPKRMWRSASSSSSWITSQNDTAPKPSRLFKSHRERWITSQNDTAPKLISLSKVEALVGLPVRTTLLQNAYS